MWPALLRGFGADEDEEDEILLTGRKEDENKDEGIEIDEEQLLTDYRHLYWSRLVTVQGFEIDLMRMWPLGPDIVEECQSLAAIERDDKEGWAPLFEPTDYNEVHGPLTIEDHQLSKEELRTWAEKTIKIRAAITEKANISLDMQSVDLEDNIQIH